jgi:hypothetical protein
MPHRDPLRVMAPAHARVRIPLVLLTHPFELALGSVLAINGVRGWLGDLSSSLLDLPEWLTLAYLIVSTIGGVGVVAGIVLRADHLVGLGVRLERSSLFLVAASYTTLALAILNVNGRGGLGIALTLLVITLACILRAVAIKKASTTILHTLTVINREAEK